MVGTIAARLLPDLGRNHFSLTGSGQGPSEPGDDGVEPHEAGGEKSVHHSPRKSGWSLSLQRAPSKREERQPATIGHAKSRMASQKSCPKRGTRLRTLTS